VSPGPAWPGWTPPKRQLEVQWPAAGAAGAARVRSKSRAAPAAAAAAARRESPAVGPAGGTNAQLPRVQMEVLRASRGGRRARCWVGA